MKKKGFNDAIVNSNVDLVTANMTIWGDPYYITDSGMGNYSAKETEFFNLTSDTTMDYQSGQVDIRLNFRTPIDYNPDTGGMIYPEDTVPVTQFNGLYRVTAIENKIQRNMFTQELTLLRRRGQPEDTSTTGTADQVNKVKDANRASQTNTGFNS